MNKHQPPQFFLKLFRWYCHPRLRIPIEGDLMELYEERVQESGIRKANWKFIRDIILLFRRDIIKPSEGTHRINPYGMFKNHIKIAFRVFGREKSFTGITLLGFSLAFWAMINMAIWIEDEWKYDRFFKDSDQLYRVVMNVEINGEIITDESTAYPLGDAIKKDFNEVSAMVRYAYPEEVEMTINGKKVNRGFAAADPNYFEVFDRPFIEGNAVNCIQGLNDMAISRTIAESFFPNQSPIGEIIRIHSGESTMEFTIKGVFEDFPVQSSNRFHTIISIENIKNMYGETDTWGNVWFATYLKLRKDADVPGLNQKLHSYAKEKAGIEWYTNFIQPYEDQYLYADFENGIQNGGRINNVLLFAGVTLFILLIASFNYVSLVNSRTLKRLKNVQIRRTVGASNAALLGQFLTQTCLLIFASIGFALALTVGTFPALEWLTGKTFTLDWNLNYLYFFLVLLFGSLILAGLYPSARLANLANRSLRGIQQSISPTSGWLKRAMVVFQFGISTLLISLTFTIKDQVAYMLNKDVGVSKENILYLKLDQPSRPKYREIKNLLAQSSTIESVGASNHDFFGGGVGFTGDIVWRNPKKEMGGQFFGVQDMDESIPSMMHLKLKEGRWFSQELRSDSNNYVINELAAQAMGMDNPVGEKLSVWEEEGTIIGVTENFHFTTLHESVKPLIMRTMKWEPNYIFIKVASGKTDQAITQLETAHDTFSSLPVQYHFLTKAMAEKYKEEKSLEQLAGYLALLAIIISSIGLIGLVLYQVSWKTKEIAIKKVLGAPLINLVKWLFKEYGLMLFLGGILSLPLASWLGEQWLENFAFRTDLAFSNYLLPLIAIALVCLAIILFQVRFVTKLNPAQTLKDE